jgi:predicted  nucleic acid-binding Zn-ribbon protein
MADIIDFPAPALGKCRSELKERDERIAALESDLLEAHKQVGNLVVVNDMLKLQLNELVNTLGNFRGLVDQSINNINTLRGQLPDFRS